MDYRNTEGHRRPGNRNGNHNFSERKTFPHILTPSDSTKCFVGFATT
jgi:hypothetical protein